MKKIFNPLFLIIAILLGAAACNAASAPAAEATVSAEPSPSAQSPVTSDTKSVQPTEEDGLPEPPKMEMIVQSYSENGDRIIEVPQLVLAKSSTALQGINERILEFAGDYERFLSGEEDVEWIQLKCYPLFDEKYFTIVMTRVVFPNYATYGDIASFCYDYQEDKEFTLADMIEMDGIDMVTPENKLLGVIPEGFEIKLFEPAAGVLSQMGNTYFYNVFVGLPDAEEGEIGKALYSRFPDGSFEEYDNIKLAFGPAEVGLLSSTPPLFWEK